MFILKEVKVVCFDALLQVLILDDLHGTKIMQRAVRERQPHLSTEKDRNAILEAATKVRSEVQEIKGSRVKGGAAGGVGEVCSR